MLELPEECCSPTGGKKVSCFVAWCFTENKKKVKRKDKIEKKRVYFKSFRSPPSSLHGSLKKSRVTCAHHQGIHTYLYSTEEIHLSISFHVYLHTHIYRRKLALDSIIFFFRFLYSIFIIHFPYSFLRFLVPTPHPFFFLEGVRGKGHYILCLYKCMDFLCVLCCVRRCVRQ